MDKEDKPGLLQSTRHPFKSRDLALSRQVNRQSQRNRAIGVSCRTLYSFVVYLYVNGSGSITSVVEERANLSAVVYL